MKNLAVILPAAGQSSRFKDKRKKPFVDLDGRAVWIRAAELFLNREDLCQLIVVIAAEDEEEFKRRYGANLAFMGVEVVLGGAERIDSVANAVKQLKDAAELVAIHDAVRPCTRKEDVDRVVEAAAKHGAALLACPVFDTLKRAGNDGTVQETVPRADLWLAQTPQVFRKDILVKAYANRHKVSRPITDDAQLVEATGVKVQLVEGPPTNIKITTRADLTLAKAILDAMPKPKLKQPLHPFAEDKMW